MAKATSSRKVAPPRPHRPADLPYGRWLGDFEPLSAIEKRLVEHCARGEPLVVDKSRPEKPSIGNRIRADIIRFLLLGGDGENPVHENEVRVRGAWIEGTLNIQYAKCKVGLDARRCIFDNSIDAIESRIPALHLMGCSIPGLIADGIRVHGDVFLGDAFESTGEVRLMSAEIGGDFSCRGGSFSSQDGDTISADRLKIKGSIFFNDGFSCKGEVRILRAEIGGVVSCIGGLFSNHGNSALCLDGAEIKGTLFLRTGSFQGIIDLATASAATFNDTQVRYDEAVLILDGFRYERIVGPTDAATRIEWLRRQRADHLGANFMPQPWEHLIRVLRDMGHPAEAAQIAMAKQKALRDARQIGRREIKPGIRGWRLRLDRGWIAFSSFLARRFHWLYGLVAGYGHRPMRIVWSMLLVCAFCSLAYYAGRNSGLIGPSAPVLQLSERLKDCGAEGIPWTSPNCPMPPEYSTFQPFLYSVDVIIPFVDLHQESEWGPIVAGAHGETLWGGRALRWLLWFEIIFGWIASVMFVGIIGRLVDKD